MLTLTPLWRLVCLLPLLAACASAPPDDAPARINEALQASGLNTDVAAHDSLQGEIELDQALWLALTHHPRARREYQRLDITHAEIVAASEWQNPTLSFSWLRAEGGGHESGFGLAQNLSALLMRPAQRRMASARYESEQQRAVAALHQLVADTESAWFALVAAEQSLAVQTLVTRAATLSAELGQRFREAGNISGLTLAQLQGEAAHARLALLAAERERAQRRAELAALLDAPGDDWSVPTALPLPPRELPPAEVLMSRALETRPDLRALDNDEAWLTENVELVSRYRWLGEVSVGVRHERETDGTRLTGPTLSFGLPLFHRNQGALRSARAQRDQWQLTREQYRQAALYDVRRLHEVLTILGSEISLREEALLPAKADVLARRQERVNFMFDGVFDLLAAKQDELYAWQEQVQALGDYWQLHARLVLATGGERFDMDALSWLDTSVLEHDAEAAAHEHHEHYEHDEHEHHRHHHHGGHH